MVSSWRLNSKKLKDALAAKTQEVSQLSLDLGLEKDTVAGIRQDWKRESQSSQEEIENLKEAVRRNCVVVNDFLEEWNRK